MRIFSRFRKENRTEDQHDREAHTDDAFGVHLQRREGMVTVDLDGFAPESRAGLTEELIRRSDLPLFEGGVTHGYSRAFVGSTETCPRCGASTRQYTANFIYATDVACRVMLAPAGYFCTACPTVIVDERMISTGMKAGYRFRRVVGVDYSGKKDPDYFGTWNGEKPIYVIDENEQIVDMMVDSEMREPGSRSQARSRGIEKRNKAKRKQAEKSRRKNRKKK